MWSFACAVALAFDRKAGVRREGWRWSVALAFDGRASEPWGDGMPAPQLHGVAR